MANKRKNTLVSREQIKRRISKVIARYAAVSTSDAYQLIPRDIIDGKLYEAHVLSRILEDFVKNERASVVLRHGSKIVLKTGGGPINRAFSHFHLQRSGQTVAEIWTDIQFLTLSYCRDRNGSAVTPGDHHELDIAVVDCGVTGRPRFDQIWFAVECKNTGYTKNLLREILGIRRELSLLHGLKRTHFNYWPDTYVPANPPSCLSVYSTSTDVHIYNAPGQTFGIHFVREAL